MRYRKLGAATAALTLFLTLSGPAPAFAQEWTTDDTDNMALSAPGGRAYTGPAEIQWRHESGTQPYEDKNAHWTARLTVQGKSGGCALLRVTTYLLTYSDVQKVSKVWPEKDSTRYGYFTQCSKHGRQSRSLEGGDTIVNAFGHQTGQRFSKVVWTVCYTRNRRTPPSSGNCDTLVRHPGD